jgi:hypothetical protein
MRWYDCYWNFSNKEYEPVYIKNATECEKDYVYDSMFMIAKILCYYNIIIKHTNA